MTEVKDGGRLTSSPQMGHIPNELFHQKQITDFTRFIPQDWFGPGVTPGLKSELVITTERNDNTYSIFKEEKAICADQNFFEFFDLPFSSGNRKTALSQGESVVISKSQSVKLFGNSDPIGSLLKVNGSAFQVSGVFPDLPANSHLQFDMVFSNSTRLSAWNVASSSVVSSYNYCKINGTSSRLAEILTENKERLIGWYLKSNQNFRINFLAQPLSEVVFSEHYNGDLFQIKSRLTLILLATVSLMVLVMAWMNYVNLAISRTKVRFKEIAARKVSGAKLMDLIAQFLIESTLVNLLAVLVGLTIIQLIKQPFSGYFDIRIIPLSEIDLNTLLFFSVVFFADVFITSFYPAWITMQITTRQLMGYDKVTQRRFLPSALTTFQYLTALVLITQIIVSYEQLGYILSKDIGLDRENIFVIESPIVGLEENGAVKMMSFAKHIESSLDPSEISLSNSVVGDLPYNIGIKKVGSDVQFAFDSPGGADENFISLYGITMLAGRNFQPDEAYNTILLSKYATERLGFKSPEEAVGNMVELSDIDPPIKLEITGVFADYRALPFFTAKNSTEDVTGRGECLFNYVFVEKIWKESVPGRVSVKLKAGQQDDFVSKVEKIYAEMFPGNVFNWYFLDDHVNRHYQQQKIIRNQISFFTLLAVGVACLGLLGMIANKVVDKRKEISVRRILGAHYFHLTTVLLDSTIKQVMVAVVIGIPIAWKLSQQYLSRYTERIEVQWWHYAIPVGILVAILFITVVSILWKAAKSNPVEALKVE